MDGGTNFSWGNKKTNNIELQMPWNAMIDYLVKIVANE